MPSQPYDERVDGLGERFLCEAVVAFSRIDETPLTGPPWKHRRLPNGVRRMFVRSFPFAAVYSLEPRVVVVALAHARQPPGYWLKRWGEV